MCELEKLIAEDIQKHHWYARETDFWMPVCAIGGAVLGETAIFCETKQIPAAEYVAMRDHPLVQVSPGIFRPPKQGQSLPPPQEGEIRSEK